MKTTSQAIAEKILFIGNEVPESFTKDKRSKFILLGTLQEFIDETSVKIRQKDQFEISCWIAEYAYKKANPDSRFSEPPSMVYEQVAKDFSHFLSN